MSNLKSVPPNSTPTKLTYAVTALDLLSAGNALTPVPVNEVGDGATVYLKPLTAGVMLDFSTLSTENQSAGIVSLLVNSLSDANGNLLFPDTDEGRADARKLPVALFNRLNSLIVASISADASNAVKNA